MLKSTKRKLAAESLETRQLLHGGGLGGASIGDRVEAIFDRYDATEDGVLNAEDELSERVTERLANADADEDGSVTTEELTAHYETKVVSRLLGIGEGGRGRGLRGNAETRVERVMEIVDADEEGDVDQGEVAEAIWTEISSADADGSGSVSSEELVAFVEAQDAERQAQFISDRVDRIFARYDADESGSLTADDVSERSWTRLSAADADGDEAVTPEELNAHMTAQAEERAAEREARAAEAAAEAEAGGDEAGAEATEEGPQRNRRGFRGRRR